jgi:acetyltransferase-like isoleucine patch superfamily enzyme
VTDSATSRIYGEVSLGVNSVVEDFCLLGHRARGDSPPRALRIGANALLRSHTVVYEGVAIGDRFSCGHGVLIREDCQIGDDCSIGSGSVIEFRVVMGNRVRVHSRCFVPEYSVLDDYSWLGPGVIVTNTRYPAGPNSKETMEAVHICPNARVGAGAILLPGVSVGAGSLVGAGAVVTQDVVPGTVVVGSPAREIARVDELRDGSYRAYPDMT